MGLADGVCANVRSELELGGDEVGEAHTGRTVRERAAEPEIFVRLLDEVASADPGRIELRPLREAREVHAAAEARQGHPHAALEASSVAVAVLEGDAELRPGGPGGLGACGREGVGVVEVDPPRGDVVATNDSGEIRTGGRRAQVEGEERVLCDAESDLAERATRGGATEAVPEAVRRAKVGGAERLLRSFFGGVDGDQAMRAERASLVAEPRAPLFHAEVELDASRDRKIALAWVVDAFQDAQAAHGLGDDDREVGVALAVDVGALVQRDARRFELDVLAVHGVEAAQVDALGDGVAFGPRHVDARSGEEHLAGIAVGRRTKRLAVDAEVGEPASRRPARAIDLHRLDRGYLLVGFFVVVLRLRRALRTRAGGGGRRHFRQEVKRNANLGGDRTISASSWRKREEARCIDRRPVEVEATRLEDRSVHDVPLRIDGHGQNHEHVFA